MIKSQIALRHAFRSLFIMAATAFVLHSSASQATAQSNSECGGPSSFEDAALDAPMEFVDATSKGNSSSSVWISATGVIGQETPAKFKAFLENLDRRSDQIFMHSPGGNLAAGLALGRMIRAAGLSTHIGQTKRSFESYTTTCDTWFDGVEAGICASSCAYAFLGGKERFVAAGSPGKLKGRLGFHQFYGNPDGGNDMLTAGQVSDIESSTLSIAQALTGQIVLYAVEMGIDPRIVAFASATSSDDLYYPTADELVDLTIASGTGLRDWFMEPYGDGLIAAVKPYQSTSLLRQVTAFCGTANGKPSLLITLTKATASYPEPADLPINAVDLTIDGELYKIPRKSLSIRYGPDEIFITFQIKNLEAVISSAQTLDFSLDAPRAMGFFSESSDLEEPERQAIRLAWKNCI